MMRRLRRWTLGLDAAQGAAQFLDFALVSDFLAFSQLDEFQQFIHLVVQFLQRIGDKSGVLDGLGNGGGAGGPEIGGLYPLALADGNARRRLGWTFLPFTAIIAPVIAPVVPAKLAAIIPARSARRFSGADRFGFGRWSRFTGRLDLRFMRLGRGGILMGVKAFWRIGVRLTKTTANLGFGFMFGGRRNLFLWCSGGRFDRFRCG